MAKWISNFIKSAKKLTVDGSCKSISIQTINGKTTVVIDGEVVCDANHSDIAKVEVNGDVGSIKTNGEVVVKGNVSRGIDSAGSVSCADVKGNIDAAGSVVCRDVHGDVDTAGSLTCGKVSGDVDAVGSVNITGS